MRHPSIAVLVRVGLAALLVWLIVIVVASIGPLWAFIGVRATTLIVPFLVAAGFAALFIGLVSLAVAGIWAAGAFAHRRWRRWVI